MQLPTMPPRIARLPRDARCYPIPWFVPITPGQEPDLRVADRKKFIEAFRRNLCWVCGDPMGKHRCFLGGPLSIANGIFVDWCMHRECAEFSVQACPFLNGDMYKRSGREYPEGTGVGLTGHIDIRPPTVGLYVFSGQVAVLPEGHLCPPKPREIVWYRDGRLISEAEALELNRVYMAAVVAGGVPIAGVNAPRTK